MKKVIVVMLTIVFTFCFSTCAVFLIRQPSPDTVTIDITPATMHELHINNEGKLNINTATADELMTLDGIGEVLAHRIIEYRDLHGPFQSESDLLNVSGIGETKLRIILPHIYIE